MTNPDDPRTPQERAYDGTESWTTDDSASRAGDEDPTQAWSRRDQPTEHLGSPEQRTEHMGPAGTPTGQFYTSDPTAAYGRNQPNPTQAYPTYDPRYDPQAPPPNATQAYPTYDAQQYQGGYPTGQYPNAQYPPGQYPGSQYQAPVAESPEEKKPRRIGTWIAATAAALLLIAVIGFGVALFTSAPNNSSSTTAAGPTTSRPPATAPPKTTTPPPSTTSESPLDQLPGGIGEAIGAAGAAFGTISANDGSTLTLDALGGSQLTVQTNAQTNVIALDGTTVADLKPGFTVMVQGTKVENGTMMAETIISTELPKLGGN
ncbi:DUF5666 domain-containing protein [Rhodococcus opacus]|uniref:DUF5666 domain-containing protein n=1 Tax=Rhodococcus opacus TaxID=37919 RepID=UPI000EA83EE2|nr:DUF5666 domain-containing protein [Rhodococcus opacus]MBA8959387.1 hypothetical protein [Rhodococcus opacus]MBP2204952.1 hypothetical protein [Rhodococcus opacus]QZS54756.1 DUF5666 domain-containing protein [Rhodococcus opacus]RKM72165.1 hypothetical protein COO55_08920 [Rhodococcus opacus]UNN03351.1 DUF5666 domain-containing protein [Rhodococcus opacus]